MGRKRTVGTDKMRQLEELVGKVKKIPAGGGRIILSKDDKIDQLNTAFPEDEAEDMQLNDEPLIQFAKLLKKIFITRPKEYWLDDSSDRFWR